jgi:predicted ester cyclase
VPPQAEWIPPSRDDRQPPKLADEPEAKAEDVFANDYVRHDLRPTQAERFPTLWRIDLLVTEDDLVAARWTASGTHDGRVGWNRTNETARRVFRREHLPVRLGGKVVEIWNHRDDLGLSEQLGAAVYAGAPGVTKLVADRQHDLPELLARLHPLVSGARVGEWEDLVDDRARTA